MIDVLPDEASLATILAMELSHIVLGHRIDTQYAFYDRMLWDDQDTFRHFGFARTPEEEQAANYKAVELLANSPYKVAACRRAAIRASAANALEGDTQPDQRSSGRQSADDVVRLRQPHRDADVRDGCSGDQCATDQR